MRTEHQPVGSHKVVEDSTLQRRGLESMLEALADLQMKNFKEACEVRVAFRCRPRQGILLWDPEVFYRFS
jgi:hypothetical protein